MNIDYTLPASLTVSFAANQTSATVTVPIINRTGFHGPRSFTVNLVSATGGFVIGAASSTTVNIGELDPDPGAIDFTASSFASSTADSSVDVTLERTVGTTGAIAVSVSVTGGSLVNGTGFSYASPTVVNFADGATTATTTISLSTLVPGTIVLGLTNPTNYSRLGAQTTATVNIAGAPGVLSFSASHYSFPETAGVVSIPVNRTAGVQGQVTVTVNTVNGTATAPSDFTALNGYIAILNDGTSSVSIPVTLLSVGQPANETNESFTITLSNPTNSATLGAITTATVRIEKLDTTAPLITLLNPAANARITTGATVLVSGTVSDDKGIDHVELQLNGGAIINVTPTGNPSLTSGAFSRSVTPVPGLNTISVQSVDVAGNVSNVISRTFTFVVNSPLTVNIDGTSPPNSGTLTAPFPGTDANREVGKTYTIAATPKTGFVFAGWSGTGIGGVSAEVPTLTFVHKAGLTITAKFVANPFTAAAVGEFAGLIKALVPANASVSTNGFIDATVTTTGTFTGTIKIDGLSLPVTGVLTPAGDARFGATRAAALVIARTDKPNLVLAFNADLSPAGTHQITGTLGEQSRSVITPLSNFVADRAAYNASSLAPTTLQGLHTIAFLSLGQTNGLTASDYPQGDGIGSVTVSSKGVATFSGTLADGSAFASAAPLAGTSATLHKVPLFSQPYGNKGALGSVVVFDSTLTDAVLSSTDVLWFKPYVAGQYYPYGWSEGVTGQLVGSKYNPASASVIPGLSAVDPFHGNATLVFSEGNLAGSLSKNVNISAANVVTKVPAVNPSFDLRITPLSGDIAGTFVHTDGTKPAYSGKIIQKGPGAGTYGFFLTSLPKVVDGTGESGRVSLTHK